MLNLIDVKQPVTHKRLSSRIPLRQDLNSADCMIENPVNRHFSSGLIADISRNGLCFASSENLAPNTVVKVIFKDDVTRANVVVWACILAEKSVSPLQKFYIFNRENFRQKGLGILRMKFYRCVRCYSFNTSEAFDSFYDRVLSDFNLKKVRARQAHSHEGFFAKKRVVYKVAETVEEREAAYRLIYQEYAARKFTVPNEYGMLTTPHLLIPSTKTYIGVYRGEVVCTASSVVDTAFGLPMDSLYGEELKPLREPDRKLVEITLLATKKDMFSAGAFSLHDSKKMSVLFKLFRYLVRDNMTQHGVTDIVISVNPKYSKLYGYLCFKTIGALKMYPNFNDQPALGLHLNLREVTNPGIMKGINRCALSQFFFRKGLKGIPSTRLDSPALSASDLDILFRKKSDLATRLERSELFRLYANFEELREWIRSLPSWKAVSNCSVPAK